MKLLIILLYFSTNLFTPQKDVLNSNWGDSKQQVAINDTLAFDTISNRSLIFIANIPSIVKYNFTKNKLNQVIFNVNTKHNYSLDYIIDYYSIYDLFLDKYGLPTKEKMIWKDNTLKYDKKQYGDALLKEQLSIYTKFENNNTDITIIISGQNNKIVFNITFTSKKFKK